MLGGEAGDVPSLEEVLGEGDVGSATGEEGVTSDAAGGVVAVTC